MATAQRQERQQESQLEAQAHEAAGGAPRWLAHVGVGALALIAGLGTLALLWLLARPLALVVLGIALAEALVPPMEWLKRWMSRSLAILLLYLAVLLVLAGISWAVVPQVAAQIQQFADRVPQLIGSLQGWFNSQGLLSASQLVQQIPAQLGRISSSLVSLPIQLLASMLEILLVFVISIYWLIDSPGMRSFALSLLPGPRQERAAEVMHRMGQAMGGYVRGIVIDGLIIGAITYVSLMIIGVNYALVLALLAGVLELIPFVGPIVAGLVMVGVALLQSPTLGLIVLAFVSVLQLLESHLLVPNIMHHETRVSPLLVLIAIFAGSAIGGVVGALVAVPLSAALRVFVSRVAAPAIRRWTGASREGQDAEQHHEQSQA